MVVQILDQFKKIRAKARNSSMRIVFTNRVDATILVKAFQFCSTLGCMMGGVHPNHCIDVSSWTSKSIQEKLALLMKNGVMAGEVKIAVPGT
eukprot:15329948-Ditylum_brightwellii.AAC.1